VRLAAGSVTLIWALAFLSDLAIFAGPRGLVPGSPAAGLAEACLIAAAASLTVGYRSRRSAGVAFGCLAWFHHIDPWALNAGDALLRDILFLLALSPAGAAWSVDAARGERRIGATRSPLVPRWGTRLIQVQVSVMYLAAVAQKLVGAPWREGTAVSYPLRIPAMIRWQLPHSLTGSPVVVHVATWGVLVTELAIGVLVWNRRARPWVLAAGVALHLAIELTLRAGFFSWIVLVSYLAFIPPEHAERLFRTGETVSRRLLLSCRAPLARSPRSPRMR